MTEHLVFVVWTISIVVLTIVAILVKMRLDASLARIEALLRLEEEFDLFADLLNEWRESESENDDDEQEDDLELDDELQSLIDDFNSLVDSEDGGTDEYEEDRNVRDS